MEILLRKCSHIVDVCFKGTNRQHSVAQTRCVLVWNCFQIISIITTWNSSICPNSSYYFSLNLCLYGIAVPIYIVSSVNIFLKLKRTPYSKHLNISNCSMKFVERLPLHKILLCQSIRTWMAAQRSFSSYNIMLPREEWNYT